METIPLPSINIRSGRFYDPQARQVILHGINLVNKDPRVGYLGPEGSAEFAALRRWGFNCVRLGVIWDGLEPEPGVISETYLDGLARQAELARRAGLYVLLDMHQDLYSVLYADGAPAWATLSDGLPHLVGGGVWSDAYFTSPAVQAALDHFWANSPAPDGLGLQDHLAWAWAAAARRLAGEPAMIGYDLLNEPFPGSAGLQSQILLFQRGAELLAGQGGPVQPSPEELAGMWLDGAGRFEILRRLEDIDLYAAIIDVTQPLYNDFERDRLGPFYRRAAAAIRAVDPHRILFLETSMGSNMGVASGIELLPGSGGAPDQQQAYAPHGYDLLVDTPEIARSSAARVELIFRRHAETAARLSLPMLVGEWGAFGGRSGTLPAAWDAAHQFERWLCGDTYWAYEPGLEQTPAFRAVSRPYPERTAGALERYHFDPGNGLLECVWLEDPSVTVPTRVYLPEWFGFTPEQVCLEPWGFGFQAERDGAAAWVEIPQLRPDCTAPSGCKESHKCKVDFRLC